jgi:hypothetical protein
MKRVLLESAPEYIILCIVVAFVYAAIQYYKVKLQPWGTGLNILLFAFRTVLTFFIAFLLLGPIVKQISNLYEKPQFVFVIDNSASVKETTDSTTLKQLQTKVGEIETALSSHGYEVSTYDLKGETQHALKFDATSSDLNGAIKKITNKYEGQNIAGIVLVSDGIYNSGLSPLYGSFNFPVHTVGIGDTTQRMDLSVKNLSYNKIAYQGNKFPVRAEVQVKNFTSQEVTVSLLKGKAVIEKQVKKTSADALLTFDFQPLANEQGIQKYDVQVAVREGEQNIRNNRASLFIEVVEGKKKILLIAPAPHPDIKALREVVEKNSNYEFLLHIPGVSEQQPNALRAEQIDLAIFHESPDQRGKTSSLFQTFVNSKSSLLLILGQQTDLHQLTRFKMPVRYESSPREFDEVTPTVNPDFSNFSITPEASSVISEFPPAYVHFGRTQVAQTTTPLLFQRVGSVTTDKPLLAVDINDSRKIAVMLGEGLWRWRLTEFDKTENTAAFDELFGKLIQFLSTTEDKRKFRSYPIKQEFSDTEPVVFESQVYNDIFEPVYGNTIEIFLTNESGQRMEYKYVTSPGNIRYQIGGLKEGVYKFRARTSINNKIEEINGQFAVVEQQAELQNLTADFGLLRKLSANTGGKFYSINALNAMGAELQKKEAKSIIHTEETYDSIINLKWVFWLLILLVSAEWFLRKYHGSY